MRATEEWVVAKGPCSAFNLITLQCSSKWTALTESWGHWKVSDWHIGWHHSNVSISRWTAEPGLIAQSQLWQFSPLLRRWKYYFLHTLTSVAHHRKFDEIANWISWPVSKSLFYVTFSPLARPRRWPQRPYGQWRPIHCLPVVFAEPVNNFKARRTLLFGCVRLQWSPDDTYSKHHFHWKPSRHMAE